MGRMSDGHLWYAGNTRNINRQMSFAQTTAKGPRSNHDRSIRYYHYYYYYYCYYRDRNQWHKLISVNVFYQTRTCIKFGFVKFDVRRMDTYDSVI